MGDQLGTWDYCAIGGYFALVLAVGIWSACRHKSNNTTGYFLAGRSMHWFPVGASIFATDIGAPTFVGLAGNAAVSGIACVIYEWHAIYILIALAWVYVPVYVASGVVTIPEYLKKRFGGTRLQMLMSVISFVLNVPAKIAPEIFAGAIFIQQFLGWNSYMSVSLILVITALYTVVGGLAAVIYTDTIQSVVILIGAIILFVITWIDIGSWGNLLTLYSEAIPNRTIHNSNYNCGFPRNDFMHIWRDPVKGDIPWTGAAFGLTLIGIWFWCSDQIIVQRSLAARNMNHSKGGAVFASYLKLSPLFLWIVPGMISRILYPDEVACPDPDSCLAACGNPAGCSNIAYPLLVVRKLPEGLRGLMFAGFLAALMSTLSSIFNSASTLFTMDIWRKFRRAATQRELMIVGRVVVLVLIVFSILWIPVMESAQGGMIWNYIQTIASCVSPPWCSVFLLGIFWKRTTEPAVFWSLIISTLLGSVRMFLEFFYKRPGCGTFTPDPRPSILKDVHFFHFAVILALVTTVLTVVISLFTEPRSPEKLRRVTWWTRNDPDQLEESDSDEDMDCKNVEDEISDDTQLEEGARPKTFWPKRRLYLWVCGIDDRPRPRLTHEDKALMKKKMQDIGEDPYARTVNNVLAVIVILITTFLLGYFG